MLGNLDLANGCVEMGSPGSRDRRGVRDTTRIRNCAFDTVAPVQDPI